MKSPKLAAMEGKVKTIEKPPDLVAEVYPAMAARPRARARPKKSNPIEQQVSKTKVLDPK